MRPIWLIQELGNSYRKEMDETLSALNSISAEIRTLDIVLYNKANTWEIPLAEDELLNRDYIFLGSTILVEKIYSLKKYNLGLFYDPSTSNVSTWIQMRGKQMLNKDAYDVTIGEAILSLDADRYYHIRPVDNVGWFPGGVYSLKEFIQLKDDQTLDSNLLITVSSAKSINSEYRVFIVNGKVVYSYRHKLGDHHTAKSDVSNDVESKIDALVCGWLPHRHCVMDVAVQSDGKAKIIGFNCLNSSVLCKHTTTSVYKELDDYYNSKSGSVL